MDFRGGSDSSAEHPDVIPRQGDSLEKNWIPTPVFLPGEFHGKRSLVDYSPWGCKEWGMTERLTLLLFRK